MAADASWADILVMRNPDGSPDTFRQEETVEGIELLHAALAAHANHRVAPIERVLHHLFPEFPAGPTIQTFVMSAKLTLEQRRWVTNSGSAIVSPAAQRDAYPVIFNLRSIIPASDSCLRPHSY